MRLIVVAVALLWMSAQPPAAYRAALEKHRHDRLEELTAPNGWLAVRGLFWLHDGANSAGSDPSSEIRLPARAPKRIGVFTLAAGTVTFAADPAADVTAAGKPVTTFTFEGRRGEASSITAAGVTLFTIRRGDKVGLRMLDPESPQRRGFKGLKYFPVSSAYRFQATFVPYEKAKQVPVPNVLGQLVSMESPGYVEFKIKGQTYRLEPVYETSRREDLFFIFKDLTSRTETYEAGRYLHTPLPKDGLVDLDFNRAYNPPCAFTEFATCPLPTKENQLNVRIPAGELRFHAPSAVSSYLADIDTFRLSGQTLRLDAVYEDERREDLWFMFTDLTSRDATYPSGRYVHAALPKDGRVILDFNKSYSPPCAFNDLAACPLPPPQNRLRVRIEAGELRPPHSMVP